MNGQRILGIVLLVVGVVLLIFGIQASNHLADQATNAITGHFTNQTMWYIIGGIVLAVVGLLVTFFGPRGRSA